MPDSVKFPPIIRKPRQIPPFNEPASHLPIMGKTLARCARDWEP